MGKTKEHIYIIDDSKTILKLTEGLLIGSYQVSLFDSGEVALESMRKDIPNLVLLDINMPKMDGYEVFQRMKDSKILQTIPVVFLTSNTTEESEAQGLEMGALDYISKPFSPIVLQQRIARLLELGNLRKNLEQIIQDKTDELQKIFIQSITAITHAVDAKDRYTRGHSLRVAQYSHAIAQKLKWSEQDCLNLYYIALLHDIGKIGIPDSVLNKPTKLTDEEYRLVRSHTVMGANILHPITMVPSICDGARYHHERYDGKGYPYGLKGEEIPYIARIIGIADAYDAITSNRIYEKAQFQDQAIEELHKGRGTQFDPYLTDVMLEIINEGFEFSEFPYIEFSQENYLPNDHDSFIIEVCNHTAKDSKKNTDKDYLTELPTRNSFEDSVNEYLDDPLNHGSMFLLDVDNFTYANENYGHITGDHIICRLADILRSHAEEDSDMCRISGDEFAIFFRNKKSKDWLEKKANDIISDFKNSISEIDTNQKISVSIGIANTRNPDEHCKQLLQKCDKALYYVKNNGKSSFQILKNGKAKASDSVSKSVQVDIYHLKQRLAEDNVPSGAFAVNFENFEKIYRLTARTISRTNSESQIILFSLTENVHGTMDLSDLNEAMNVLERCIVGSLRKGDVTAPYSSSQQVVILPDCNEENGLIIAERIIKNYSRMYDNYNVELLYNIEPVVLNAEN